MREDNYQELLEEIREIYKDTYPNIIVALMNKIDELQEKLGE